MRRSEWFFGLALASCVAGCINIPPPADPQRVLPTYVGIDTEMFNDAIDPRVLGVELDTSTRAKNDPVFRERMRLSDAYVRGRIQTVNQRLAEDETPIMEVTIDVVEGLGGPFPMREPSFTVRIGPKSNAYGALKNQLDHLMSKTFIAFTRAFTDANDDRAIHFYILPDNADTLERMHEASLLSNVQ